MDGITKQTRRQSYDGIRTRSGERCKLILETLGNRSMTVEEITDELVAAGHLKYYNRNFVAPRLTELKGAGVLEVVGKKPSKRTGKNTAVWAAVRRSRSHGRRQKKMCQLHELLRLILLRLCLCELQNIRIARR